MSQRRPARDPIAAYTTSRNRMIRSLLLLVAVTFCGALGYWYLGRVYVDGGWSLNDCIYMTAITITTVGYSEVMDVGSIPGGREWTLFLLVVGTSANLYVFSAITSFLVESDFTNVRRYRRLLRRMQDISNHYVICGAGRTGMHVLEELLAIGEGAVVIDQQEALLADLRARGVLTLQGDATDDGVLQQAGIERAKGFVSTLEDDRTNLFVILSARQANPRMRIVSKAVAAESIPKLRRAGADAVVSPTMIGGLRLASELVRPQVVRFLDEMLRDKDARLRIEEAVVGGSGPVVGRTLGETNLREKVGALVMAIRHTDGRVEHAPAPTTRIEPGQVLIAIGRPDEIQGLRKAVGHPFC